MTQRPRLFSADCEFLWVGHRGAGATACSTHIENTLPSFQSAIDHGATMIEFDIQLTKDFHPIIWHDPTLTPCQFPSLSDSLPSSAISLNDWRQLSLDPYCSPPSLSDVFNTFLDRVYYYCELKYYPNQSPEYYQRLVVETLSLLDDFGLNSHCLVVSFEPKLLNLIPRTFDCLIGVNQHPNYRPLDLLTRPVDCYCPSFPHYATRPTSPWAGPVIPYTVNTPAAVTDCRAPHCAGLTTDYLWLKTHD